MLISYSKNLSSMEEIQTHLESVSFSFIPPLNERVDIGEYSKKIYLNAIRFEAWYDESLIGLVACYVNDFVNKIAYVTNVSVDSKMRGQGVAHHLLANLLNDEDLHSFNYVCLEVNRSNVIATSLYRSFGFEQNEIRDQNVIMRLKL